MKKLLSIFIVCLALVACGKKEINELKMENSKLREQISQLEAENKALKETDQYYYQQGISLLEANNYPGAKDKFNDLIAKFPNSSLIGNAQEQLKVIEKNRKEATEAINNLPKTLAKTSSALEADEILTKLEKTYNYDDVKEVINTHRKELQERIKKEKEMESALKDLGIEISNVRTYWTIDRNVMGGQPLVIPYMRFNIKNVGTNPITKLNFSASFELTDKKEMLGEGSSYVISPYSDHPLKPGYSKEVFFGSGTGYVTSGYDAYYRSYPRVNADMYVEVNDSPKRIIKEIRIRREFKE